MIGIIISGVVVILWIVAIPLFAGIQDDVFAGKVMLILSAFLIIFGLCLPTLIIMNDTHNPGQDRLSPKQKIESVDKQDDVYIFTLKDGTQVAKSSYSVIVSDVSDEPGIQYGNKYSSWGNFWSKEDIIRDEVIVYTPSNKG